jgi:hypothetical protein
MTRLAPRALALDHGSGDLEPMTRIALSMQLIYGSFGFLSYRLHNRVSGAWASPLTPIFDRRPIDF